MRIIFEQRNNKVQGANLLPITKEKNPGLNLNEFQNNILETIVENPKLKIAGATMLWHKMAFDIAKKG